MAPSLRDLIDFLLAEIALCGSQGESTAELKLVSFLTMIHPCIRPGPAQSGLFGCTMDIVGSIH